MFDIASWELLLILLVALLVIGPKEMPNVLRFMGRWVGKARTVMAQFRSGLDDMVRQAEVKEIEEKWEAENQRIMREHPAEDMTEAEKQGHVPDASNVNNTKASDNELPLEGGENKSSGHD